MDRTSSKNEASSSEICSVFISGLPYSSTEADVKDFFKNCGDIIEIKLPRYQDTGKLIGYGHVVFSSSECINEALKLNGEKIGGRYIDVKVAKGEKEHSTKPKSGQETNKIFIKNLSYDITEDEVGDAFRHCGEITNVRFVYHSSKNHFKGFGYIDFKNPESSKKALQMNGKLLKGRKIIVDLEYGDPKAGFKYRGNEETNTKYNTETKNIIRKKIKKEKEKNNNSGPELISLKQKEKLEKMKAINSKKSH